MIAFMGFFSLVLLALALSIDCFAVCLIFGMQRSAYQRSLKAGEKDPFPSLTGSAAKAGLVFAFYHIVMIVLGWLLGWGLDSIVARYDHWVAFALLLGIGVKTIIDGFNSRDTQLKVHAMFDWKSLLLMGLAVSIDAFAVGISLKMVQVALWEVCLTVPVVVFLVSVLGVFLGFHSHKLVQKLSLPVINLIGGLVLIGIGLRILIEHLSA